LTGLASALALALFCASITADPVSARQVGNDFYLENGLVRLVLEHKGSHYLEKVYARKGSGWSLVLAGTGSQGETLRFRADLKTLRIHYQSVEIRLNSPAASLVLKAAVGGHGVETTVSLESGQPWFSYRVRLHIRNKTYLESLECDYRFLPEQQSKALFPLDTGWCPGQRLTGGNVLADQLFHSPLALMQKGGAMAALVADVKQIPKDRTFKTAMQYQAGTAAAATGPTFSYGLMDYILVGHVYFKHDASMSYLVSDGSFGFGFYLRVEEGVSGPLALENASKMLWSLFGNPVQTTSTHPQYAPFERCIRAAYDWAFRSPYTQKAWHEFKYGGLPCGGTDMYVTFDRKRKGEVTRVPDIDGIWFQSWFNNFQSAFGMYIMGLSLQDPDLVRRANLIKNLALTAPVDRGLFPAVFLPVQNGPAYGRWQNSIPFVLDPKRPDDYYYHVPDAAWTGYWMIRWFQMLQGDVRLALRAKDLADRITTLQTASGAVPAFLARGSQKPQPELLESASTAASALFLVRTHVVLRDAKHLAAARKALDFLETRVVPEGKWWDYETTHSCTNHQLFSRDPSTGLHDAGTMSMIWAAAAFGEMYEATREARYLATGRRIVDELSLYQHLHDKPWHFGIPSFGGFTSQNRDAEQNDARQALAAPVFLDYYRFTGREAYFHRGVAALRAGFTNTYLPENVPVWVVLNLYFPWFGPEDHGFTEENTFHNGHTGAPFIMRASNFNWGGGSAAAAVALAQFRYGDIYVDLARDKAIGLNGCRAAFHRLNPDVVQVTFFETQGKTRKVRMVVEGVPSGKALYFGNAYTLPTSHFHMDHPVPVQGSLGAQDFQLYANKVVTYRLTLR